MINTIRLTNAQCRLLVELINIMRATLPDMERLATEEAWANAAPTGLPRRTERQDRAQRARDILAKLRA